MRKVALFNQAFVHKSVFYHAMREKRSVVVRTNNERLEFFGDAMMGAAVSEVLYEKFKRANEGFLTKLRSNLVCRKTLDEVAVRLGFLEYIKVNLRGGEKDASAVSHITGNVLEAFVGAVYFDGGYGAVLKFVKRYIASDDQINRMLSRGKTGVPAKSSALEWGQKNKRTVEFFTREVGHKGVNYVFESVIKIDGQEIVRGEGGNKKMAENDASSKMLDKISKGEIVWEEELGGEEVAEEDVAEDLVENNVEDELVCADEKHDMVDEICGENSDGE